MTWLDNVLEQLIACPIGGYTPGGPPSSEPTALASLGLSAHGYQDPASSAADWLVRLQAPEGSVSIRPGHTTPRWPTALAVLAWKQIRSAGGTKSSEFSSMIRGACRWIVSTKGEVLPSNALFGHDVKLLGWPWVEGTHSWLEPTALHVLALKAAGYSEHDRTREAVRLLFDRILPGGGCNYGNTYVLGNRLDAHIQPTALMLLALHGEADPAGRIKRSIAYLEREAARCSSMTSLCWALIALTVFRCRPADADERLQALWTQCSQRRIGTHKLALLALAGLSTNAPVFGNHIGTRA